MVVTAIQDYAALDDEAPPIRLSPGQAEALVSAVVRWGTSPGSPVDVALTLGRRSVAQLNKLGEPRAPR